MASVFLMPALFSAFCRRANRQGAIAARSPGPPSRWPLYVYGSILGHQKVDQLIGPPPASNGF